MHIADLHERAADAGIDGYRLLGRDDLIERLERGGGEPASPRRRSAPDIDPNGDTDELAVVGPGGTATPPAEDSGSEAGPERPRRRRGRRGGRGRGGRARERLDRGGRDADGRSERGETAGGDPDATEEITGTLEITRQRHGFLSVEGSDDDVYVSASQIRRCELTEGDEVSGPARAPRRGERHRALVRVNQVNGEEPVSEPVARAASRKDEEPRGRPGEDSAAARDEGRPASSAAPDPDPEPELEPEPERFDSLTPVSAARRIELPEDTKIVVRAADLLAPLGLGQRVLVRGAPRSGRTTLLRGLAKALQSAEGIELTVILIDERPEEVSAWSEAVPEADLALAPADLPSAEQVGVAQKALDHARKRASEGADVVLLCDSLTRLAVAAGGVDEVKRLFGSGREFSEEDAGSLTVIATTLGDSDDDAERAVQTTESALITLDATLAAEGIIPAIRFAECRAVGEDVLLSHVEVDGLRRLRTSLAAMLPPAAAALIRERLARSATNAEVLQGLAASGV